MQAGKIKQLNRLVTNEEVHTRKTIIIPKHPNQTPLPPKQTNVTRKTSNIDLVVAKTGVSKEEAKYYLDDNHGVVAHAVAAIKQDEEWEKETKEDAAGDEDEKEVTHKPVGCFTWGRTEEQEILLVCPLLSLPV